MIGHMLGSQTFDANSCGLMLCPVFSYQKHKLFVEEHALLQMLANSSCLVDMMFQLNFDPKSKSALCLELDSDVFLSNSCPLHTQPASKTSSSLWAVRISETSGLWRTMGAF